MPNFFCIVLAEIITEKFPETFYYVIYLCVWTFSRVSKLGAL